MESFLSDDCFPNEKSWRFVSDENEPSVRRVRMRPLLGLANAKSIDDHFGQNGYIRRMRKVMVVVWGGARLFAETL